MNQQPITERVTIDGRDFILLPRDWRFPYRWPINRRDPAGADVVAYLVRECGRLSPTGGDYWLIDAPSWDEAFAEPLRELGGCADWPGLSRARIDAARARLGEERIAW